MIRTIAAALAATVLSIAGLTAVASPASAARESRACDWGPSGWDTAQVCVTVTYFQPTASQYEITKVKVEANSVGDVKRVDFTLLLWNGADEVKWQRDGTLNSSNGWDKVYTPDSLRVGTNGSRMGCWGNIYYDAGGAGFFAADADL